MDVFTLIIRCATKVVKSAWLYFIKLYIPAVNRDMDKAFNLALSDWSEHDPTYTELLHLWKVAKEYIRNPNSYEALDTGTQKFIDCFKKRQSGQPAAHNYLMTLRADEQANHLQQVLSNQQTTNSYLQELLSKAESTGMTPQYISSILKELPIQEGREITATAIKEMFESGRIHSEAAKDLVAEITNYIFQHTENLREEIERLRQTDNSLLTETLEEIKKVLTGESELSLTAIYEKLKEQERQNEVKVLKELIAVAQIRFSFGEARTFYEQLIKLAPTVEHQLNYADLLQRLNDFKKARSLYEELLQEFKQLAKQSPEAYTFYSIVAILNNLGMLLCNTNDLNSAQDCFREALQISQKWITQNPEKFQSAAAATRNNWGNLCLKLGELKQAQEHYEKELQIYRNLAKTNPQAYLPDVAMALHNLATLYSKEGEEAEKVYQEAFDIYQRLTNINPNAYEINYARLLTMGVALLEKPTEYLEKAKAILSKQAELPEAQELLSVIEKLAKK